MNTGKTVVYLCSLPGCCHEEEKVYNLPYFDCPWCGTNMMPIPGSEKPIPQCYDPKWIREQLDYLMGYTAEDIKNEI